MRAYYLNPKDPEQHIATSTAGPLENHAVNPINSSSGEKTVKTLSSIVAAMVLSASVSVPAFAVQETYVVDPMHSYPRFSYDHFGYSTQLSRFNKTSGTIVFDKAAKTGSVDIVIDMKSVNTGSSALDEVIQAADLLDTEKFPTATFKSTKVRFKDDKLIAIDGDLTIKGVTKPVTLTVTSFQSMVHPMLKKDAIGANAYTVVKRSAFAAGKYAPHVGDDVRIDIAVEAIKE